MLRFYYVIAISIPLILYYIAIARYYFNHEEKYDELKCYGLALRIVHDVMKRARISTVSYGEATLPKDSGYIMYCNHQGKFDALGIMHAHTKPCSVVMDAERSRMPLANELVALVRGVRLERHDIKQQYSELSRLIEETKKGRKFIYFPEGKYEHNGNKLQEFRPGAFKCAVKAKCPIVPVAIYDSHIPFEFNSLKRVTTQVYFLDPIPYEEYCNLTTKEISEMVKNIIEEKLQWLEDNRQENGFNDWLDLYRKTVV